MVEASKPLPSGTVTFLFTDIEGSTKRWDDAPDAMQRAVRAHDGIMRSTIAGHGGYVFKTIGDAFCAAFPSARSAIAAALQAQERLGAVDFSLVDGLRVRMAINTGVADERDGDYFGPALNRVARLLALGHGGQVLVSSATATLARGELRADTSLAELGSHRLKDLSEPETVYQLLAPTLRREFPALRSLQVLSNNLPAEISTFVGRRAESDEISRALGEHRLVTIVGPGGIGKTRASLHVAAGMLDRFTDGVWFVQLAQISDGALIPSVAAASLGVSLPPDGDEVTALITALRNKTLLLVVDNCEHVLNDAAKVAAAILRACPDVRMLASSRQALGIVGEAVVRMPPLPVEEAVTLFVARAQAGDTRFLPRKDDAKVVERIVERLDCIPLAIELAAARIRLLGLGKLEDRLAHRFRLLVGGGRDAAERQHTLRATIDWSYDLLDERERRLFRRAGIFAGPFTAEAFAAIVGDDELREDDGLDALSSLEDKSLLAIDQEAEVTRFRLLESMRAYALERVDEHGESRMLAKRHLQYFSELAQRAEEAFLRTGSDTVSIRALAGMVSEVRTAIAWSLAGGDVEAGAALSAALGRPWARLGLSGEGIARVEAFIAAVPPSQTRLRARLWTELAWLAGNSLRNVRAYEAATEAVRLARIDRDAATTAWSLAYFALAAARMRRLDQAEAALRESRALAGPNPLPGQRKTELEVAAFVAHLRGDVDSAARAFEEQLSLLRATGDEYAAANAAMSLAETEHARGNTARAIELIQGILPGASGLLGSESHAAALANQAGYLLALDEVKRGHAVAQQAIALLGDRDPSSVWVIIALEHAALALALEGDAGRAARIEGYCDAAFRRVGFEREATEEQSHTRLVALLRERLHEDTLARRLAEGSALSPQLALAEGR